MAEMEAFREKGYRMMIACQPHSKIHQKATEAGFTVFPVVMRKGFSLHTIRSTLEILRKNQVDLVHTHSSVDAKNCGLAARIARVPVVRSRHLTAPIKRNPLSKFVYMYLADCVLTSGQAIRERMIRINRMDPKRIFSVPAGVDTRHFHPAVDSSEVVKELQLGDDMFVVSIVAVIRSWKGHEFLIDAVARLLNENLKIKLLIVGTGPHEPLIMQQIQRLGIADRIVMTGYRTDVPELMRASNCVVLPSTKNEATSQALPQAMAERIPVISSSAGGLTEVVQDRENGLLVPPEDSDALAEAIRWIYTNQEEARAMADRAYHHCMRNFTFDKMIEDTDAAYQFALDRHH